MKMRKIVVFWLSVLALAGLAASAQAYTVKVAEAENCTVSISPEKTDYEEGDEITVTLTANAGSTFDIFELFYECSEDEWWEAQSSMAKRHGFKAPRRRASSFTYRLESYYFNDYYDDEYEEVEEGVKYTFTMPARNVEVEAIFLADDTEYDIAVTQTANGTTEVSASKAIAGDTITITAKPADGYIVGEVKVYERVSSGNMVFESLTEYKNIDSTHFKFAMPANPVRVEVEYSDGKIAGDVNRDGSVTIADVTALVDIILGKDEVIPYRYDHDAADVNGDDSITVADVTALVEIILR